MYVFMILDVAAMNQDDGLRFPELDLGRRMESSGSNIQR